MASARYTLIQCKQLVQSAVLRFWLRLSASFYLRCVDDSGFGFGSFCSGRLGQAVSVPMSFFLVGKTHKIVNACIVKAGKAFHNYKRWFKLACFIAGVGLLGAAEIFGKVTLIKVIIFTEHSYSESHYYHLTNIIAYSLNVYAVIH